MALCRLSLLFSLLLLSLLVIASADDYGGRSSKYGFDGIPADSPQDNVSSKYGFDGIPADSPQAKPDGEEKPHYGTKPDYYKPKPVDKEKPDYGKKLEVVKSKPEEEEPNYGTKEDIYKPKPEEKSKEKEKHDYDEKPYVVKTKPEEEEKHYYGAKPEEKPGYGKGEKKPDYDTKQYLYKPKTEEKEKPEYGRQSYVVKPEPEGEEKPYYGTKPEKKENCLSIGVQGLVLCKSGSKYYPIQGALAKITCKAVDEVGVEKTLSICSGATDAKGYFFATVSHLDKLKLRECKAYLQSSPSNTCNVPTNVNKAIDGALLSAFRVLKEKRVKLYSVGPFFYTSEAKSASNGY
ncbi:hypothetical protein CRYUN_Cryun01aG0190400 [Craigia yunnanensis]